MKHKHLRKGRPSKVVSPIVDEDDPENYPSLIRYLEAHKKISYTTDLQLRLAKKMYLKAVSIDKIAADIKVQPSIISRWALCFGWDELRDRILFEKFRKINGVDTMFKANLSERHERIAGGIEQIAERILQNHVDGAEGQMLNPRDLKTLASTLKDTQEIRRTARGETGITKKEETRNNVNILNLSTTGDKVVNAIIDAFDRPVLERKHTKSIAVGTEEAIGHDTEYEDSINRHSEKS